MTPRLKRTRGDLSAFLRSHRDRLSPAAVGLPDTRRRRAKGLRREEVAALAGVGLTWYTWFEQGRDVGVSEDFLLKVARALRLDDAECRHLFLLAHRRPPATDVYDGRKVSNGIRGLLDDLVNRPAYVLNLRNDLVAWNDAAARLLPLRKDGNLLASVFLDPDFAGRLPRWEHDAGRLLAAFRLDRAAAPDDPLATALVDRLTGASPEFRRLWSRTEIVGYARGFSAIQSESGQALTFGHETLMIEDDRQLRMVVHFEDDPLGC